MRKMISPWLAAAATAFFISAAAPGGKTVHADELFKEETTVSVNAEEDNSDDMSEESRNEKEDSVIDSEDAEEDVVTDNSDESEETAEEDEKTEEAIADSETTEEAVIEAVTETTEETVVESEAETTEEAVEEKAETTEEAVIEAVEEKTETIEETSIEAEAEKKSIEAVVETAAEVETEAETDKIAEKAEEDAKAEVVITNDEKPMASTKTWKQVGDKWRLYYGTGENDFYKGGMVEYGGYTYSFDADGNMQTGWISDGTNDFYADENGRLVTGWMTQNGVSFHFGNPNGNQNGVRRYMMNKNRIYEFEDGAYYFAPNGVMRVGWISDSDGDYYAGKDGILKQGWAKIDNNWYFFGFLFGPDEMYEYDMNKDRIMEIGGFSYYFDKDGKLAENTWFELIDKKQNTNKYYAKKGGILAQGFTQIDNNWYYFGSYMPDGTISGFIMNKDAKKGIGDYYYYFDKDGKLAENTWFELIDKMQNTYKYYAKKGGILAQGFTQIDNNWYFFGYLRHKDVISDNFLKKGNLVWKDKQYYFDQDGIMQTGFFKRKTYGINPINDVLEEYDVPSYADSNGVILTEKGWKKIDGNWYYNSSPEGFLEIGLKEINGKKYYFDEDGVLKTGLHTRIKWKYKNILGSEFAEKDYRIPCYSDAYGVITAGWKQVGGKWYYSDKDGILSAGKEEYIGKDWYYFDENGEMKTGWQKFVTEEMKNFEKEGILKQVVSVNWKYYESWGAAAKGWKTIGGKKYYFDSEGKMAIGLCITDKGIYYFDKNGALMTDKSGWMVSSRCWFSDIEPVLFLINKDGSIKVPDKNELTGDIYAIDEDGVIKKNFRVKMIVGKGAWGIYLTDEKGKVINDKTGWIKMSAYNVNPYGSEAHWYYLNSDGYADVQIVKEIDGVNYGFDESGRLITNGLSEFELWDNSINGYRGFLADASGKEVTGEGWHCVNDKWYFIQEGEISRNGIYRIGGIQYLFRPNGTLCINSGFYINGRYISTDNNGRVINEPLSGK